MSDSRLAGVAHFQFARHETFAPRFGWLHKAYMQVRDNPEVFLAEDAPVMLGVGKNMVNAMRYWSRAFKLTREARSREGTTSRAMYAYPTWEARWLLDEDGADPYLEEPGSLWLLHWWLLSSRPGAKGWAPSWYVAFHLAPFSRFTLPDLTQLIVRHVNLSFPEAPVESSIAKDVDCLAKMYVPAQRKAGAPGALEDLLACPFRELGLLEQVGQRGSPEWQFTTGTRTSLPARIIAYACLDYAAAKTSGSTSVSLARLANEAGSPGRAFRVREPVIAAALEQVAGAHPEIQITEAVGQRRLSYMADPFALAWDILDEQYDQVRSSSDFPTRDEWGQKYPQLADAKQRELGPTTQDPQLPIDAKEDA
ncbi:DUF4007 family protein [Actinomadura soli]|uniref:DUF4007 family protein n=1 Tax=Actinomadura soli TaxID=2508997 RepID=A0A5C4JGW1_9ACTN|nr:DUF4007 family protein [Actinomadura soli]TMR04371.1 DUF4007 family protein [Actinomadura soli]